MTTNREWLYSLDVADLADWFDAEHVDANDVDVSQDSREKLEADASELTADYAASGDVCDALYGGIVGLLDRQAAITEREVLTQPDERDEQIAELTAQVDELSQQLINARADCEQYRELFSKAITHAHEIVNLQP